MMFCLFQIHNAGGYGSEFESDAEQNERRFVVLVESAGNMVKSVNGF